MVLVETATLLTLDYDELLRRGNVYILVQHNLSSNLYTFQNCYSMTPISLLHKLTLCIITIPEGLYSNILTVMLI